VLDEDEATRTLKDYELDPVADSIFCKPYKCGKCEYRTARKDNAYAHMHKVHKVEFYKTKRLVKVLPLDEAAKTVDDYNKKFVSMDGRFRPQLQLDRNAKTGSAAKNSGFISMVQPL
jgi:hypothetical protein